MAAHRPVMLIILDGWGIREMEAGNAVALGRTPNFDRWLRTRERSIIQTSGEFVGLVPDQMGNSEVGHLNLGAGRIVYQDITRIDIAIKDGSLAKNEVLVQTLERARNGHNNVHLIGLLGPGGVHSHESHLYALLAIAGQQGIDPVVHVITDGRDTPPNSGIGFLANLEARISEIGAGRIATVSGRYYAM
ncbi:MAG TPA: 2,3-bisphosphoglycerate-independent phosphoglycerate mutase, partial [Spirillospora sp.]|nr:2,3-bisphosphoglycerate-independent phosphoglycerate mutase [Spirillospora sp.]